MSCEIEGDKSCGDRTAFGVNESGGVFSSNGSLIWLFKLIMLSTASLIVGFTSASFDVMNWLTSCFRGLSTWLTGSTVIGIILGSDYEGAILFEVFLDALSDLLESFMRDRELLFLPLIGGSS